MACRSIMEANLKYYFAAAGIAMLLGACNETTGPESVAVASSEACSDIAGEWRGQKVGSGYEGPLTITIASNCSFRWRNDAREITTGNIRRQGDAINWSCANNLSGDIILSGNQMTWHDRSANPFTVSSTRS